MTAIFKKTPYFIKISPNSKVPPKGTNAVHSEPVVEEELQRHLIMGGNLAIVTGQKSDFIVFDCDTKINPHCIGQFQEYLDVHGVDTSELIIVNTPSGGVHYYFSYPNQLIPNLNETQFKIKGVGVSSDNRYVLVPPSKIDEVGYEYQNEKTIYDIPLVLPESIIADILAIKPVEQVAQQNNVVPLNAYNHSEKNIENAINYLRAAIANNPASKGNRNNVCYQLATFQNDFNISCEKWIEILRKEWLEKLSEPLEEREFLTTVRSAEKTARKERGAKANNSPDKPTTQEIKSIANKIIDKQKELNERYDKLVLPDDFYLSAPCGMGGLVEQIMRRATYPSGAAAYHGALAIKAALLSRFAYLSTPMGVITPNYYSILFANTGRGKEIVERVVCQTLYDLIPDFVISNKLKSDVAIYNFLHDNKNQGLYFIDEIHGVLNSIIDPRSPVYLRQINEVLLSLYSKANYTKLTYERAAKNAKDATVVTLYRPHLSIFGATVSSNFSKMFNQGTFQSGLMQRVQCHFASVKRPEGIYPSEYNPVIKDSFLSDLANHSVKAKHDDDFDTPDDMFQAGNALEDYQAFELSDAAKEFVKKLRIENDKKYNEQANNSKFQYAARATEKALKEAFLIEAGSVGVKALDFANKHNQHLSAILEAQIGSLESTEDSNKCDEILYKIAQLSQKTDDGGVSRRELQRVCRFLNVNEFNHIIHFLDLNNQIQIIKKDNDRGKKTTVLYLLD